MTKQAFGVQGQDNAAPFTQEGRRLLLNGRFLSRTPTGVDRSATHIVRAMLQLRRSEPSIRFNLDLAVPRSAPPDDEIRETLSLDEDHVIHRGRTNGYLWEQLELPFICGDATLLSLCNTGPLLRANQLVLMHDAQVFEVPESYSFAFRTLYQTLLPLLARRTRWLATVSQFSREHLRQYGVGRDRPMGVIRNGMDHLVSTDAQESVLHLNGLEPGKYLLAFASAAKHKNVASLIDVLKARKGADLPLVLVGSNNARIFGDAEMPKGDKVRFVGRVSDEELSALYRNAAVFLLPSLTEGFGLPAAEAMSWGCPVIASTGGALSEVYEGAAVLKAPNDTVGWAAAIDEMIGSEHVRQKWVKRGRDHVARFGWTESARSLLKVIEANPRDS